MSRGFLPSMMARSFTPGAFAGRRCVMLLTVLSLAVLAGCASRTTPAPVVDLTADEAVTTTAKGTYVVKPGDTLYKIAQAHGTDIGSLTRLNQLTDPSQLRVGQVLRLDGETTLPAAPVQPPQAPVTTPVETTPPVAKPVEPEPARTARASDASIVDWGWPATGRIIQGFNANTKGIDIEGNSGDPVIAAASGKVIYAGNGVRGLGNLVLLSHTDGFISAYAHNRTLLVKTGQNIKKGEKIAEVGQTDTTSPRLHFEIRRRGTAVNPLSYLPPR